MSGTIKALAGRIESTSKGREYMVLDPLQSGQRLVPDLTAKLRGRYKVLQRIYLHQPIGRRSLAQVMGLTERVLRADVELLKEQGLIDVGPLGMTISEAGTTVLADLDEVVRDLDGRSGLERRLSHLLGIPHIVIVPGDCQNDETVMRDLGYGAALIVRSYIASQSPYTIAVTGGSSLAWLTEMMPHSANNQPVEVLPARGGMGERLEFLANTIASRLAEKLGGTYRMFHVPELMSRQTAEQLALEPSIQEMVDRIRQADLVIHGIGEAITMAKRRHLDEWTTQSLKKSGAVAEAFGYYFNENGEIIHMMSTLGLRLEDLSKIPKVIGVAGGADKAVAIRAVAKAYHMDALITDEGAARTIIAAAEEESN